MFRFIIPTLALTLSAASAQAEVSLSIPLETGATSTIATASYSCAGGRLSPRNMSMPVPIRWRSCPLMVRPAASPMWFPARARAMPRASISGCQRAQTRRWKTSLRKAA